MATKVDELIVEIRAETKHLRAGMSRVNKQLDRANTKAKAAKISFSGLGKVFLALGLGRLAVGVVRTVKTFEDLEATLQANTGNAKETAKALGMIEEFTSKTTFQIEEVTAAFIELKRKGISATREEMQGLGNVAAANNQSIEQVAMGVTRAATTSIEQLQMLGFQGKSSGDMITLSFGEGADKLEKTFKKTTANVLEFVSAIGDEKYHTAIADRANTVSGAFSNLGDNIGFFAKAIGEGGLKKSLIEGVRGLSKMMIAAKPLGALIGGAISKAFEGFNAIMNLSRPIVIGLTAALLLMAAPAIWTTLSGMVIAAYTAMKTLTLAVIAQNTAWLASPITWIVAGVAAVIAGIYLLYKNVDKLKVLWHNTFQVRIPNGLTHVQIAFMRLKNAIINIINDLLAKIQPAFESIITAWNKIAIIKVEMPDFNIDTTEAIGKLEKLDQKLIDTTKLLQEYSEGVNTGVFKTGFNAVKNFVTGVGSEEELQLIDFSQLPQRRKDSDYFGPKSLSMLESMTAAFEEMKPAIIETTNAFTNDFVNALLSGESAMDSFKDFAKSMVSQIISTFMQLAVINTILNSIFNLGGTKAALPTLGAPKAGGGTVQGGRPVLVGERGAEMFIPNSSGRIVNNQGFNQMGGGATTVVNQSISFSTGIVPTVRAEVMKMMPQIADVTKAAVAEGAMRGGSFRRALAGG